MPHKPDCRVYDIKDIKGRGKGLVARRILVPGEIVLKEKALVLVQTPNTPKVRAVFINSESRRGGGGGGWAKVPKGIYQG